MDFTLDELRLLKNAMKTELLDETNTEEDKQKCLTVLNKISFKYQVKKHEEDILKKHWTDMPNISFEIKKKKDFTTHKEYKVIESKLDDALEEFNIFLLLNLNEKEKKAEEKRLLKPILKEHSVFLKTHNLDIGLK